MVYNRSMKKLKKIIKYWKKHLIFRRFVVFLGLFSIWFSLLLGAFLSPERVTYSKDLMATQMKFNNKSGEINLVKQTYSEETGVILLEFVTDDYTSSISKGITASNLSWKLRAKVPSDNLSMDIIPLTDNRITVVVKGVPKNFDALGIVITNGTVVDKNLDIGIDKYGSNQSFRTKNKSNNQTTKDGDDTIQFLVTTQSTDLKKKSIENLSRERFTLKVLNDERKFNLKQITKLNKAIQALESGIIENNKTLEALNKEAKYLVGTNLEEKNKEISEVTADSLSKAKSITTAQENIKTVNNNIEALDKSIAAVKDGTYEFNSPITSVSELSK